MFFFPEPIVTLTRLFTSVILVSASSFFIFFYVIVVLQRKPKWAS